MSEARRRTVLRHARPSGDDVIDIGHGRGNDVIPAPPLSP